MMPEHPHSEEIRAYVEGELTPDQAAAFEARMAEDPELEQLVQDYRGTMSLLRTTVQSQPPVSPEFLTAVQRRIRLRGRQNRVQPKSRVLLGNLGLLGVIVTLVLVSFNLMFPNQSRLEFKPENLVMRTTSAPSQELIGEFAMAPVDIPDGRAMKLLLGPDNQEQVRKLIAPILVPEDRDRLEKLKVDQDNRYYLLLLPPNVDLAPIQFTF